MKFLFVIDNLGSGGAQNQVSKIAVALKERGHDVSVFTYYEQDFFKHRLENAGVRLFSEPKKNKLGWNVIIQLKRLIKSENPDIIIAYLNTPNFYAALAKKLSRRNSKLVISYRSKTDIKKLSRISRKMKEWVNDYVDFIFCNSYHERQNWIEHYPKHKNKIKTIYNIVDVENFTPGKGVESDSTFLAVGKVRPLKNSLKLIEALHILHKKYNCKASIHWYGSREFNNSIFQDHQKKVDELIKKYHLENFWIWHLPSKNMSQIYPRYKALIHPSFLEGLPNVICESLACGVPVLTSNVLDHPVLIKEGERGLLFDPNNAEDIAKKMFDFLQLDEEAKIQFGVNCRNYAQKTFNEKEILNTTLKILSTS